jgi:hypothetical protein
MQEVVGTRSKHIEYSSFVSLLKNHQFRRITHRQQGALRSDRIHEYHRYTHFFFLRNQKILLSYIQRKDLPVLGYPVQASGVGGQSQPGLKSEIGLSLERLNKSLLRLEDTWCKLEDALCKLEDTLRQTFGSQLAEGGNA